MRSPLFAVVWAAVAGCGAPAPPVAGNHLSPPAARALPVTFVFRTLLVGPQGASRTTFVLTLDGDHAQLLQSSDRDPSARTLADADRVTAWQPGAIVPFTGTRTAVAHSNAFDLALETPGQQPLALHCARTTIAAAAAGSLLVRDPDAPCSAAWSTPAIGAVDALSCTPPGEATGDAGAADADDDDQLTFAAAPGLEHPSQRDAGCALHAGLRAAR